MSRSFAIRFYTKHDIDLLTLYYRNVDVANVMHQVLVAFIKGEEFLLSLPNPSEDDFQPQSTHGAKVEYRLEKKSYEMDILGEMDILEDEYSSEDALLHRPGVRFEDDEEGNDND